MDKEQVRKLAHLSRLELDDAEINSLQNDLSRIVEYVNQLKEVDVDGVECMTHAVPMSLRLREDQREDVLGQTAVAESAGFENGYVRVPKIIE
jgi:aspartyl-tRNA(Asn)/glutamyl-tRNA(Gln) amidotransferase subunit C